MRKIICLLLLLGICLCSITALTSCEESADTGISKEEWDALNDPELYKNFTAKTTVTESSSKIVTEQRVVDGIVYTTSTSYALETDEVLSSTPWEISDFSIALLLPEYDSVKYDKEAGVYRHTEASSDSLPEIIREYTITDGKVSSTDSEMWQDIASLGAVKITVHAEYSNYGTTVAPEINE